MSTSALDDLLTPQELADYLSVPLKTIYSHRYTGVGPPGIRVGRHLRFRKADVAAWIEGLTETGAHPARTQL